MIDTKSRSKEIELMDDFGMTGKTLIDTLDQIAKINHLLGGNGLTMSGLRQVLKKHPKNKSISIVDLGCGNGDMLRLIADYGRKHGYSFRLVGIDANAHTIAYANKLSENYPEITYLTEDILADDYQAVACDLLLATLFLHHFTDKEIADVLRQHLKKTRMAVLVNDLHRHKMAYYLFRFVTLGIKNHMVKNDGAISILRGFKRKDLEVFSSELKAKSSIKWKWAFRYQWLLEPNT